MQDHSNVGNSIASTISNSGSDARQLYEAVLQTPPGMDCNLPMLLAMVTGELTDVEIERTCLEEFVIKGWLIQEQVNVAVWNLNIELGRRFQLAKYRDEDDLPKEVNLSGSMEDLKAWMVPITEDGSRTFPLVCVRVKYWVIKNIKSFIDTIARHRQGEVDSEPSATSDYS